MDIKTIFPVTFEITKVTSKLRIQYSLKVFPPLIAISREVTIDSYFSGEKTFRLYCIQFPGELQTWKKLQAVQAALADISLEIQLFWGHFDWWWRKKSLRWRMDDCEFKTEDGELWIEDGQ